MKPNRFIVLTTVLVAPLWAQVPVPPPGVVVEKTVTETVTPGQRVVEETVVQTPAVPPSAAPGAFDPRGRLSVAPRALPVTPGTTTETTETTTTRVGGRVYNTERNVVIVEGRELPYVTLPVLFVKETAELLDSESRAALDVTAAAIHDVLRSDASAVFDVEGHTSTDGSDELNLSLSAARAKRVYQELTVRYRVPTSALSAHGYGEAYPQYPDGSESEMILDRRVLVVRAK